MVLLLCIEHRHCCLNDDLPGVSSHIRRSDTGCHPPGTQPDHSPENTGRADTLQLSNQSSVSCAVDQAFNDTNDDNNDDDDSNSNNNDDTTTTNNNNNNYIQGCSSRFLTISSLRHELSPTRSLKWPGCNRVQIMCNTSSAHHVQHAVPLSTKGQLSC